MKVQFSSLAYLQNWRTRFVYFLLMPIISLSLLILINAQYTNSLQWPVAVATIVLSGGTLAMTSIAQLFVMDRNLKIDLEMVVNRPLSLHYWGTKVATAMLAGLVLIGINLVLLSVFRAPYLLIIRALTMSPIIVVSGTIVGFFSAIAAWQNNNPYFYLNIVSALATIVAGTLILIDHYPLWLRIISLFFPFSQTIKYVVVGSGKLYIDLGIDAIWLLLGIVLYRVQCHTVLKRHHQIW
ncbi:antibiotic transporter permease [Levilactobacillus sp. N40-8-2]|uniref:antibiotic transporter permease n=1 Tax=Levilactobacillus muriae TaxID=3238987 RepID=UPI0038B2F81C